MAGNDPYGGFIRYILREVLGQQKGDDGFPMDEERFRRETLRGIAYILERLNQLEAELLERIEKQ